MFSFMKEPFEEPVLFRKSNIVYAYEHEVLYIENHKMMPKIREIVDFLVRCSSSFYAKGKCIYNRNRCILSVIQNPYFTAQDVIRVIYEGVDEKRKRRYSTKGLNLGELYIPGPDMIFPEISARCGPDYNPDLIVFQAMDQLLS